MAQSRVGDDSTTVELTTEETLYPKTFVSTDWDSDRKSPPGVTVRLPWLLIILLVVVALIFAALWFSGVKPAQLLGR
jgi:hypothetical protein